jgi:hypothetical protein
MKGCDSQSDDLVCYCRWSGNRKWYENMSMQIGMFEQVFMFRKDLMVRGWRASRVGGHLMNPYQRYDIVIGVLRP